MTALLEDMIKCTQKYLVLFAFSEKKNNLTTSWGKWFYIMNWLQQRFKIDNIFVWYTSIVISSCSFKNVKLKWYFSMIIYTCTFHAILAETA